MSLVFAILFLCVGAHTMATEGATLAFWGTLILSNLWAGVYHLERRM